MRDYEETRGKLIALLTAANEDDLSMYIQLQDELWQDENDVDQVLTAALFFSLGLIDEAIKGTDISVLEYLQTMALMRADS